MSKSNEEKKEKIPCKADPRLFGGGWFVFPKEFSDNMADLSEASIRVYLYFRSCFNWEKNEDRVWPTYETISKVTGIKSNTTIRDAIIDLAEWGWLDWVDRKFSGNNTYHINSVPIKNDAFCSNIEVAKKHMSDAIKKAKEKKAKEKIDDNSDTKSTDNVDLKSKIWTTKLQNLDNQESNNCSLEVQNLESNYINSNKTNVNEINSNEINPNKIKSNEINLCLVGQANQNMGEPTEDSSLSSEPVIDFDDDWGIPETKEIIESNDTSDKLPASLGFTKERMKEYADSVNQHSDYDY
ncbi:MAG: hypothetical protein NTZ74_08190 [Chloroflexi bacterium]|nr:hypothetical protein [Chloroflexota bacterium]